MFIIIEPARKTNTLMKFDDKTKFKLILTI